MKNIYLIIVFLVFILSKTYAGEEHSHEPHVYHEGEENHQLPELEDDEHSKHIRMSNELIKQYKVKTERASPQLIQKQISFYGVIKTPQDKSTLISAPYKSKVAGVYVAIGQQVKKGQKLIRLVNTKNLESYYIKSPVSGLLVERWVNSGEIVQQKPLLKVIDLSKVWVDFTVFPKQLIKLKSKLKAQLPLRVSTLDGGNFAMSHLSYILPILTGGHLAQARGVLDNQKGIWFAGMHVMVNLTVDEKGVSLAVKTMGIQTVKGKKVVFVKKGQNFEPREVETGVSDGEFTQILSGLAKNEEYVTQNSFLMKADLMKHDAGHGHSH
jgi:cobalt-zinc-cadmium efflux system membrane fusion protein